MCRGAVDSDDEGVMNLVQDAHEVVGIGKCEASK